MGNKHVLCENYYLNTSFNFNFLKIKFPLCFENKNKNPHTKPVFNKKSNVFGIIKKYLLVSQKKYKKKNLLIYVFHPTKRILSVVTKINNLAKPLKLAGFSFMWMWREQASNFLLYRPKQTNRATKMRKDFNFLTFLLRQYRNSLIAKDELHFFQVQRSTMFLIIIITILVSSTSIH